MPKVTRSRSLYSLLARAMICVGLFTGCSIDEEPEYVELTVYDLYSQGIEYLEDGRYRDASIYFDEVERQHPYSIWATKSKLMSAYSHYQNNKYEDSIASIDRFIQVHPGNRDVVYAYYLKALCYYEQISDVQRDQDMTQEALFALEDVVTRFPDTVYARDARLKIDLTRDHLAGKEMTVGRFYLRRSHYLAAINRFKIVIENYAATTHAPEALYRLVEAYTALGIKEEARRSAAVLGYNYPGSDWYLDSYRLIEEPIPPRSNTNIETASQAQSPSQGSEEKPWYVFW